MSTFGSSFVKHNLINMSSIAIKVGEYFWGIIPRTKKKGFKANVVPLR